MDKHILNSTRELVNESLTGLGRLNPALEVDTSNRIAILKKVPKDRVALVSSRLGSFTRL